MKWRPNKASADTRPAKAGAAPEGKNASPSPKQSKSGSGGKQTAAKGRKSFTLLVGDEGAILVFMQGATLVRRLFAASPQPEHIAPLLELMKANPKVPVSILADVLDQQYVRHTFPPVSPMSIAGLVKRRIDRDFNPEDMKAALSLGRETEGRKEWQYLIISLANTPLMQQWIDFIVELPNPMLGVYLLPVEMQQFLPAFAKALGGNTDLPWKFLVTHNKVSGFRLVVLFEGKLVFTRVSQVVEDVIPAVIAGNIEQEIMSTMEYLRRLNFKENTTLELIVIAAQEVAEALDLKRFEVGASWAVTPFAVAEAMQLKQAALSADRFGDVVVAAAIGTARKRVLRFSNTYIDQLAQLYKMHLAVLVVAGLLTLALLGAGASTVMDILDVQQALSAEAIKKQAVQREIADLQHAIDGLDKNVAYKALVSAVYESYGKNQTNVNNFAAALAPLVTDAIHVRHLEWGDTTPSPAGAPAAAVPAGGTGNATPPITVEFTLLSAVNDPEALTKVADKFLALVKDKMPNYDIVAQPYSWAGQKQETQEISLDASAPAAAGQPPQNTVENKFTLIFTGPHKPGAGSPAGAGAPGAAGGGGR